MFSEISYKLRSIVLLFAVICTGLLSCHNNRQLQSEIEALTGQQVIFPAKMTPDSRMFSRRKTS